MGTKNNRGLFTRFASHTSRFAGHPATCASAMGVVILWGVTGPLFGYSDTWQLVINTGTTIITFLMVFLIQNSQNRDSAAVHIKLDELIRTAEHANQALLDLEELDESELDRIRNEFEKRAERARHNMKKRDSSGG